MRLKPTVQQSGFTLLELLVAISIFAIISVISYGTLIRVIDQDERLERERRYWQVLGSSLVRLEEDLAFAVPRSIRDAGGFPVPAFIGQPVDDRAVSPPSLEFSRLGSWITQTSTTPALQRVAYRVRDGELLREIWPSIDRAPVDQARSFVLIKDVELFELRFYDGRTPWQDRWPLKENQDALPRGIKLTLKIKNREPIQRLFLVNG
jgi:general secretion pathway protein J